MAASRDNSLLPKSIVRTSQELVGRSLALRYGCSVVSVGLVALIRLGLHHWFGSRASFGLFFISVVLTSWFAGFGPGMLSIVLGLLTGLGFLTTSQHLLAFRDPVEWVGLINFVLAGLLVVILTEKQRRAKSQIEANIQVLNEKQTQLEQQQAEMESLNLRLRHAMRETHHRVKNNLQVVSALVEIQADPGEPTISATAIKRIGTHVRALATIHDLLTAESYESVDANALHAKAIMDRLIPLVRTTVGDRQIRYEADDMILTARQGTALALLMNELVSNAIKHGGGDTEISLQIETEAARLEVRDHGSGFSDHFDPHRCANMGLELIDTIARRDLSGTVEFANHDRGGACVVVRFPVSPPSANGSSAPKEQHLPSVSDLLLKDDTIQHLFQ